MKRLYLRANGKFEGGRKQLKNEEALWGFLVLEGG